LQTRRVFLEKGGAEEEKTTLPRKGGGVPTGKEVERKENPVGRNYY